MGLGAMFGKLFGGSGGDADAKAEAAEAVEYNGYTIVAAPLKDGSQYKTAGSISKEVAGELKTASFIRADNHGDKDSAISYSQSKAQQIIDEQGEAIFQREHV